MGLPITKDLLEFTGISFPKRAVTSSVSCWICLTGAEFWWLSDVTPLNEIGQLRSWDPPRNDTSSSVLPTLHDSATWIWSQRSLEQEDSKHSLYLMCYNMNLQRTIPASPWLCPYKENKFGIKNQAWATFPLPLILTACMISMCFLFNFWWVSSTPALKLAGISLSPKTHWSVMCSTLCARMLLLEGGWSVQEIEHGKHRIDSMTRIIES